MKVGDLVKHKEDNDIGIILKLGKYSDGLHEIYWLFDGHMGLCFYGINGENLEVISESQ